MQSVNLVMYRPYHSSLEPLIDNLFPSVNPLRLFNNNVKSFNNQFRLDENESQYLVELDLPGFNQTDVSVEIENETLFVCAKNDKRGEQSHSLELWDGANIADIAAKMENGVLIITLPKQEKAKKRKIELT